MIFGNGKQIEKKNQTVRNEDTFNMLFTMAGLNIHAQSEPDLLDNKFLPIKTWVLTPII